MKQFIWKLIWMLPSWLHTQFMLLTNYRLVQMTDGPDMFYYWKKGELWPPKKEKNMDYSFCESASASSSSPWCVRLLTDQGQKLSGGVDTESLCGRVKPPFGWDLSVPFSIKHPSICPKCKKLILEERK